MVGAYGLVSASRRVLVVDDEPAIIFALSEYLTVRGYEVDSALGLLDAEALLGVDADRYRVW